MNWIWPREPNPFPSAIGRLGRLIHYVSILAAAYVMWILFQDAQQPPAWRLPADAAAFVWLGAIAIYLGGRGARWVFAAE